MNGDKKNFLLGLFIGIAVIAVIAFFVLLAVFLKGDKPASPIVNQGDNQPPVVDNNPPAETGDSSRLSPVTKDSHVRGDFNAPVTMIVFDDFECPFCLRFEDTLDRVLNEYQGKIRVVYRHFPLSFHANAQKAAEASECAAEQGKFWEMHDKIFEAAANSNMGVTTWQTEAKSLGLDANQFNDCLSSGKYASKIANDFAEGQVVGVQGTPATFINGELVSGAIPYDDFPNSEGKMQEGIKSIIERHLR